MNAVIGIAVGVGAPVLLAAILIPVLCICCKKRKEKKNESRADKYKETDNKNQKTDMENIMAKNTEF
jgi:hypothetical protein